MTPNTLTRPTGPASSGLPVDTGATLSKYLPKDASYFYGFPAGNESDFYNNVPAWVEELVSARTLVCSGPTVHPVVFASAASSQVRHWMTEHCGVELSKEESCIQIPASVTDEITGRERNAAVREVLEYSLTEKTLFMAQPFLDPSLAPLFHLDPKLSVQFNDKTHLPSYIPAEYLPTRYVTFNSGSEFAAAASVHLPCVVKVASSSAGDGVRICTTEADVANAQEAFKEVTDRIFIEEFIEAVGNYCIQFGIPHDAAQPIEIIGYNHQVITEVGEFLGSVVCPPHVIADPILLDVFTVMTDTILPKVRATGWHGIGGLDVLISSTGKFYFIDPNFRQTATFGLVSLSRRGLMKKNAVGFIGTFKGTTEEFEKVLSYANPANPRHMLQMISMSQKGDLFRFNAGLLFENQEELAENVRMLRELKVEGKVIDLISNGYQIHL